MGKILQPDIAGKPVSKNGNIINKETSKRIIGNRHASIDVITHVSDR
jgi:hypothetical protein